MSDELVEYATLGRARPEALREEVKRMSDLVDRPKLARRKRLLEEQAYEILVARHRCEQRQAERDRLSHAAAQRPQVGLGAILCGGAGELVGRDFTG
jgi:hypothetical protein